MTWVIIWSKRFTILRFAVISSRSFSLFLSRTLSSLLSFLGELRDGAGLMGSRIEIYEVILALVVFAKFQLEFCTVNSAFLLLYERS